MNPKTKNPFRVIINDDCNSHNRFNLELFELWGKTAVNTYMLCVGTDVYWYDTKVSDSYKEALIRAKESGRLVIERNSANEGSECDWYRILVEDGIDPLALAINGCRKNGLEIFASLRMNDIHHATDPEGTLGSLWWRAHPELRAKGWDRRGWASYNFAFPEVRQRRLDVIRDIVSRYDVDGIDLDFTRMPPFFDRGKEYENRHHMTGLVREARKILDKEGRKKNKEIKLSAACLANIRRSKEVGLDVEVWIKERLVDIVIPSYLKQDASDIPVEEFLELTRGTDVEICPNFGSGAWPTGPCRRNAEIIRAMALNCHRRGADGLQLFNLFWLENPEDKGLYDQGVFSDLADPAFLKNKDKDYSFQQGLPIALTVGKLPPHDYYYWLDVPRGVRLPPPVPGRKEKGRAEYRFFIPDDIEKGRAAHTLIEQRLSLTIAYTSWQENIEFFLNGERIPKETVDSKFMASDPLPAYRSMPPYTKHEINLGKLKGVKNGWNNLGINVLGWDKTKVTSDIYKGLDLIFFEAKLILRYF